MTTKLRMPAAFGICVVLGLGLSGQACAETLALDCRSAVPDLVVHIWVSSEPKSVTVQPVVRGQSQAPHTESGSGITIDASKVFWRDTVGPGNASSETIDRNTGTWTSQRYSGSDGLTQQAAPLIYHCEPGTATPPPAKF